MLIRIPIAIMDTAEYTLPITGKEYDGEVLLNIDFKLKDAEPLMTTGQHIDPVKKGRLMAYESREEIDSKYKWDLSSMFPSDEAFEVGLEELKAYCPKLLAFKGKISTSAQALLEFLQLEDQMTLLLYKNIIISSFYA